MLRPGDSCVTMHTTWLSCSQVCFLPCNLIAHVLLATRLGSVEAPLGLPSVCSRVITRTPIEQPNSPKAPEVFT